MKYSTQETEISDDTKPFTKMLIAHIIFLKVRDISAHVCRDLITYMKANGIHPNPAKAMKIKPLYETLDLDSTADRKILARSLSQIHDFKSCCPSCGANITKVFPAV